MKTKTVMSLLLAIVCLLFASATTGTELKFVTQDFAPFSYEIDGIISGPVVEIIKRVCGKMGVAYSFGMYPWTRAQMMVEKGEANSLFVIGWNEERAKSLYFSPPVLNTEYGFFVQDNNPLQYKQPSDINGYVVGVYGPSNTLKSLEEITSDAKDIKIDMTVNDEAGFKKLSLGRVKAVYSNRDVGYALIEKLHLKKIRYAGANKKLKYFIGFSQKHTDRRLVDQFNKAYMELYNNGEIQNILKMYSMEPAKITSDHH